MAAKEGKEDVSDMVAGVVAAFVGKHGQVDIRFQRVAVSMSGTPFGVEVNGAVSVTVHMRDLTETERKAHVASNLAAIGH
jgi:hypothetical protein